jgi:phage FluMu protein Com
MNLKNWLEWEMWERSRTAYIMRKCPVCKMQSLNFYREVEPINFQYVKDINVPNTILKICSLCNYQEWCKWE